jgi:hypothetical protein
LLAVWYLLTSLPAESLAMAAQIDFPCAHHSCGCKSAQQCLLRCCCFPKTGKHRTAAESAWSIALCGTGAQPDATGASGLGPHLPLPVLLAHAVEAAARMHPPARAAQSFLYVRCLEKIPI